MNTDNERVEKLLKAVAPPECDSEPHRRQVWEQVLARLNTDRSKAGVSRGWRTATLLLGLLCVAATASQVVREMKMSQARQVHYEGRDDEGTYHFTVEQPESTNTDSGIHSSTYSISGGTELSAAEIERARKDFEEVQALSQKKAGELEGVSDITINGKFWHRTFLVKYKLSDGLTTSMGQGDPDPGENPPDEKFEQSPQGAKRGLTKSDWAEIRKLHNQGEPIEKYYRTVKGRLFKFSPVRYVLSDGTEIIMSHGKLCQGDTDSLTLWVRAIAGPPGSPSVNESFWEMNLQNLKKAPPVVIIRPTQFSGGGTMGNPTGPLIARSLDFKGLISFAYPFKRSGFLHPFNRERIILPANAPDDSYDLMFTIPGHSSKPLQEAIIKQFGLAARTEVRQVDALVLKVKDPARLAAHVSKPGSKMDFKNDKDGSMAWFAFPITSVSDYVEGVLKKPVVVSDGLCERYDIALKAREQSRESLPRALGEAGLELVPSREPVEMLVVEKAGESISSSTHAASVDGSLWETKLENLKKAPPVLIIRPAQSSDGGVMGNPTGPLIARNLDLKGLVAFAHPSNRGGCPIPFWRQRIILPADAPDDRYDLIFTLRDHSSKPLQEAITKQLGFTARKETRQTDVLLLKVKDPARLAAHARKPGSKMEFKSEGGAMVWSAFPMSFVADQVEAICKKPVVVSGDISGRYDMALQKDEQTREALPRALGEAGLELVPSRQAVEMLVVEKAAR